MLTKHWKWARSASLWCATKYQEVVFLSWSVIFVEVRLLDFPTFVPSPKKPNTHIVYVGIYYGRNDDWGEESFFLILPNPWYRLHARPEGSRCCPVLGEKSHKDWIGPCSVGLDCYPYSSSQTKTMYKYNGCCHITWKIENSITEYYI